MSKIDNPDYIAPTESPIAIHWDGTQIYTGTDTSWTDIDCGVGEAVVLLRIVAQSGTTGTIYFRRKGDELEINGSSVYSQYSNGANFVGYALLTTDVDGYVQIKTATISGCTVYRLAYWKANFPKKLFFGTLPTIWTDLSLGYKNSLCLLRITTTTVGACSLRFRVNGETVEMQDWDYDIASKLSFAAAATCYAVVVTDSDGIVEVKGGGPSDYQLWVDAVIPANDVNPESFYTGAIPAAWTDLTTAYGKSIVYAKNVNDANSGTLGRENGETLSALKSGATYLPGQNALVGYGIVICDYAGVAEWIRGAAANTILTKQAVLR